MGEGEGDVEEKQAVGDAASERDGGEEIERARSPDRGAVSGSVGDDFPSAHAPGLVVVGMKPAKV